MESLVLLGFLVGFLSGFFGIGGGTILVPLLLLLGYGMKAAVGMSLIQMLFSSVWGSWLNFKEGRLQAQIILYLGIGGWIGSYFSPILLDFVSETFLEILFLVAILLALVKLFYTPAQPETIKKLPPSILMLIGASIGLFASSIGVGGAIFITPLLNGFLGYDLKIAAAAALFFVTFSSLSATLSWSVHNELLLQEGVMIGLGSLVGVYVGLWVAQKSDSRAFKLLLIVLNVIIFFYMLGRLLVQQFLA